MTVVAALTYMIPHFTACHDSGLSFTDRIGKKYWGDGPKFICGAEYLAKVDCLVYSFGSNLDDQFEKGLLGVAPNCEVSTQQQLQQRCIPSRSLGTVDVRVSAVCSSAKRSRLREAACVV